jgi:hypothetical protein
MMHRSRAGSTRNFQNFEHRGTTIFTPKVPKKQPVSTLVLIVNEKEYNYVITGAVCGFGGRSWGKRGSAKAQTGLDPPPRTDDRPRACAFLLYYHIEIKTIY